jgi:hypothetical protein
MDTARFLCFILPVLVTGCAVPVDDPDNPSIRGKWVKTVRIASHRFNGGGVDPSQLGDWAKDPPPEEFCGEVRFRDTDELRRMFERQFKAKCTVETYDYSSNQLSGKFKCDLPSDGENDHDTILSFKGSIGPDKSRVDGALVSRVMVPTGETHRLTADLIIEARRMDDC